MLVRMQRNWITHAYLVGRLGWFGHSGKMQQFLIQLTIDLLYDPTIVLLTFTPQNENLCAHKNLYKNIHSRFICNSTKLETT